MWLNVHMKANYSPTEEPAEDLAARIARLQSRRADQRVHTPNVPEPASGDEAMKARIAALAGRRAAPATTKRTVPARRRSPAKKSKIAALTLSLVMTSGLTAAFAANGKGSTNAGGGGLVSAIAAQPTAGLAPTTTSSVPPVATSPTTTVPQFTIVNGDVFSNRYGDVQVQATFATDGSLADVTVLEAPKDDRESAQISSYAVPKLNSEALTIQSASVDTISGATYTSRDYARSLQSAIDIVRAGEVTAQA